MMRCIPPSSDTYDILGIGFGPSNLALAVAVSSSGYNGAVGFIEDKTAFSWHGDMMLPGAKMQVMFLKDLITQKDPTSPFTFINYLHEQERLNSFINLRALYPSRNDYQGYFAWAADKFSHCVQYACSASMIAPIENATGEVEGFEVHCHDLRSGERTIKRARNIVMATGGSPALPCGISPQDLSARLFHSSQYLSRLEALKATEKNPALRVLIVGGGQSAAEIFQHVLHEFPHARVDLAVRNHSLMPANSSAFSNEIFDPASVDAFYESSATIKEHTLRHLRHTNYAAVDEDLIQALYGQLYEERLAGHDRARILNYHALTHVTKDDQFLDVTLRDERTQATTVNRYDTVILATGYNQQHAHRLLSGVDHLLLRHPDGSLKVARDYSLETRPSVSARLFVQGPTEHSHGLTSSLISILPFRAHDILSAASKAPDTHLHDKTALAMECI
ncbi:lysine N(6)-hydroxylase/L-ornithine N(5)-oxygenase family protein [Pseudomonas sp. UV AK001]|uniref:lysine N(6)-hydroxylase/L-ornithine N(5)-oxygenase family protein n=1 Tax=Pseudomonas sp. UV AK001 TaxID=3384791 RepID=UPI0038D44640